MRFNDQGYIVNLRKHGENSAVLTVLSREHGKVTGFVKHALSKKNLGVFQLGNQVQFEAYSRVDENMLSLKVELLSPDAVNFIADPQKLSVLAAFCALSNAVLPELENLEDFYACVDNFFKLINEENWLTYYLYFEYYLLEYLGIGLDLSECAATGTTRDLAYVSPKTGKAVCRVAGEAYRDRLFAYPRFIIEKNEFPAPAEQRALLQMTGFFLQKNFFNLHSLKFPPNRASLLDNLNL